MHPKIIFSDFDGTLTRDEQLSPIFFEILDLVSRHGSELVIVSGRSVSWGHFLLTHFPMQAALMEGGGVLVTNDKGCLKTEPLIDEEILDDLDRFAFKMRDDLPDCPFSTDSYGRLTDRAIELSEIGDNQVLKDEIHRYLSEHKVHFSTSNVHINFWMGEISKYKAVQFFLEELRPTVEIEETVFYGDSLNDESLFEGMPYSIGVSNIDKVLDQLKYKPKVVLRGEENIGPHGVLRHLQSLFASK